MNNLPINAVVKGKKKREEKRRNSSRFCGKAGNMCLLFTFPQTIQGEREKKRGAVRLKSNPKSPVRVVIQYGERKREKETGERKRYSSKFSSGLRARTSPEGVMRLGVPLRTMRVRCWPAPKRKRPYLTNCWRVMPLSEISSMRWDQITIL